MVSLVPARPQPVEGEPRAPAVEGRVGQRGGRELDAPKLAPILQDYWDDGIVESWNRGIGRPRRPRPPGSRRSVGRKLQMFLKFIAMARTFALFARARDRS